MSCGVRGLNPDDPPGQEVLQMSIVIQAASPGGGNTMHKDMDDFSYRQQDIVKLGTIVMSLYWIVTKTYNRQDGIMAEHSTYQVQNS